MFAQLVRFTESLKSLLPVSTRVFAGELSTLVMPQSWPRYAQNSSRNNGTMNLGWHDNMVSLGISPCPSSIKLRRIRGHHPPQLVKAHLRQPLDAQRAKLPPA